MKGAMFAAALVTFGCFVFPVFAQQQDLQEIMNATEESLLNITAFQELVKRLSTAGSFEEALRIQTAFMHSQLNRLGKQTTSIGATYTKTADNADKKRLKESSD